MEKCREVTQGYSTKQQCDKWPQQVCKLEKFGRLNPKTDTIFCRQLCPKVVDEKLVSNKYHCGVSFGQNCLL